MSFLEHLEEFRWTILKAGVSIIVVTAVSAFFSKWIIDVILLGPAKPDFFMYKFFGLDFVELDLQNRTITGQFFAHWGTVLAVGAILGSPFVVFFLWKFVEPGLYPSEKKGLRFASVFATFFFAAGIAFGYLILTPLALFFFSNYQISPQIVNDFDITKYFSMITFWAFGCGILFELPVMVYFLAKLGLLTPDLMRHYRKYAIVIILLLAALFTPPDPASMVLVALPIFGLYQMSITIAAAVERRRQKDLDAALS